MPKVGDLRRGLTMSRSLPPGQFVVVFRAVVKGRLTKEGAVSRVWVGLAEPGDDMLFVRPLVQLVARPMCPCHHPSRVTRGNDAIAFQRTYKSIVVFVCMRRGRRRNDQRNCHRYRR